MSVDHSKFEYVSRSTPSQSRLWPFRLFAFTVIAVVIAIALESDVKQVRTQIDATTGTIVRQTTYAFGIYTRTVTTTSPIETRLRIGNIGWTPVWQFLHNTHYNAFGRPIRFECGTAPPIYKLNVVAQRYAATSTDRELSDLVRILTNGSDSDQRVAIDAACEKALNVP